MKMLIAMLALVAIVGCDKKGPVAPSDTGPIFSAAFDAPSVKVNVASTLRWNSLDPTARVQIDPPNSPTLGNNFEATGNLVVVPLLPGVFNYTLTARTSKGTTQRLVTLVVTP